MRRTALSRARAVVLASLLAPVPVVPARAQFNEWAAREPEPLLPAQVVLSRVRAAFPPDPLLVLARLECFDAEGETERTLQVRLLLAWRGDPSSAAFLVADAFGTPLAQLTVERPLQGAARFTYAEGDPAKPRPLPSLQTPVAGTDFTWSDLALSFLWWPGGTTAGVATKKGRSCYVVDVPAPDAKGPYASVRLWIDTRVFALLEAEARDAAGRVLRRLEVKSLKKIDGLWTLKDLEVHSPPAGTRTLLRVRDIQLLGAARATDAGGADAREDAP